MGDILRKIEEIEYEMAKTQKNKATSGHLGMLKAKLAKLRRELISPKSGGGSAAQESFEVAKTGDARIGFVGFPSVGKSTLLSNLAGVYSEVRVPGNVTQHSVPGNVSALSTWQCVTALSTWHCVAALNLQCHQVAAYEFTTLTTVPGCIKYKVRNIGH